ncbi:SDR family NAD(P)-dependent oxidoreductase [Leucobacter komagatae]|uniref:Oxidoreductase n=1 Tax=Leucobacter komagatae TaxID=55969 RepID=A0A0D0HW12_9MICO|nr:SDR family oxidoreductase [Leucobacter komagatae]KIP51826.1 oxidoreductase [Leucobacter komagatae]
MAQRTVLITGGTRGIGRACALALAAEGSDVVLGYARDDAAAAVTKAEIIDAGVRCLTVRADLTTDEGIETLFAAATEWSRGIDAVVNNAGATLNVGSLLDTPTDVIRRVVDLNLTSAILVARRAVRALGAGGVLVNISSGAATTGSPGEYVHYAAAKAGVDALTKGLAIEAAPGHVRVVGVAPGTIDTDIHASAGDPDRTARVAQRHPMGRAGTVTEVASVVLFALSEGASYISGTTLRVAGGV